MKAKFVVVLLTLLVVGILIVLSYREDGIIVYPVYKVSTIKGFRLTHKEDNIVKWELLAKSAKFPEGGDKIELNDLSMGIHHGQEIRLTGGSGLYDIQDKSLIINKPIEIDIRGTKLVTDSLMWNSNKGLITTEGNIKLTGKNFLIQGTGLTAKVKEQQIRILKNVKGVFYNW